MTHDGNAIGVRDLCFLYGDREVLHNVTFEVPVGAFVAVVGPNGGGKTTLLRLLLGTLRPRYGSLTVLGRRPDRARQLIGYVPQHLLFDPTFPVSVLDVALIGLAARRTWGGFTRAERRQALASLEQVALGPLAHRSFGTLSGGQRQRAMLAQALVCAPELLLLDEPTANVDPDVERQLYALLRDLNRRATIVVVSHNHSVVTAHASHVLCVNRGADIHPMSEFAADPVGLEKDTPHLRLIHHGSACQVLLPDPYLSTPHRGAAGERSA